jgi:hypothetical protein
MPDGGVEVVCGHRGSKVIAIDVFERVRKLME